MMMTMKKMPAWRISVLAVVVLAAGTYAVMKVAPWWIPELLKAVLRTSSGVHSFEFLGCSGQWTDTDMRAQAWRTRRNERTTLLVKHPAACGFTTGSDPQAKIVGSSVALTYSMSNDSGDVAACDCEYWATFDLKSAPDPLTKISINGTEARLMGDLSAH